MSASSSHASAEIEARLKAKSGQLTSWLFDRALPVWSDAGRDGDGGGFYELVDIETGKGSETPRRARVQPRQIYSFIEAGRLGWSGPWEQAARSGLDFYLDHYFTEAGTAGALVAADGTMLDAAFDLYNQSFALFCLGTSAGAFADRREALLETATGLHAALVRDFKHAEAGFHEANPPRVPLCSNPHMHMFEACLALETVDAEGPWRVQADEIATLAMDHFIDPVNGGLREFFDADWSPMPDDSGRVMEPGHQFEWAWLLARWGQSRNHADALVCARRLFQIGEAHGIADHGAAIMALNDDFSVRDPLARLWGQTEWLKAALILASVSRDIERDAYHQSALRACAALERYFATPIKGLWYDKLDPDGSFRQEAAPASSFYHIICAISELDGYTKAL